MLNFIFRIFDVARFRNIHTTVFQLTKFNSENFNFAKQTLFSVSFVNACIAIHAEKKEGLAYFVQFVYQC